MIGKSNWDAITPLTQGMAESSLGVYKISFGKQHYVAKLKSLDKPQELVNEFEHMKLASDLNACPKVHYINAEGGIAIVDFVENFIEGSFRCVNSLSQEIFLFFLGELRVILRFLCLLEK